MRLARNEYKMVVASRITVCIYVAGGNTGTGSIYDAGTGVLVQEYSFTAPGGFVNDVIVTRDAASFTQSAF